MMLFLLSVLVTPPALAAPKGAEVHMNPHGRPEACEACHDPAEADASPEEIAFRRGTITATCHSCHGSDPHPVDIPPGAITVPPNLLLVDGLISCHTCHDEPACDSTQVDSKNPTFLRGGPYENAEKICEQCHEWKDTVGSFNPHESVRDGTADDRVCELCHIREEDGEIDTPGLAYVCLNCHRPMPHAGSRSHYGEMPADMAARAVRNGLPLSRGTHLVCPTCHDLHPEEDSDIDAREGEYVLPEWWRKGVLDVVMEKREAVAGALEPVVVENFLVRQPLYKGQLCLGCHDWKTIGKTPKP